MGTAHGAPTDRYLPPLVLPIRVSDPVSLLPGVCAVHTAHSARSPSSKYPLPQGTRMSGMSPADRMVTWPKSVLKGVDWAGRRLIEKRAVVLELRT